MVKKLLVLGVGLFFASSAFAQTPARRIMGDEIPVRVEKPKFNQSPTSSVGPKKTFEEQKEALKSAFEEKKQEFKQALEEKRNEMKTQIEAKRTELKKRLEVIKDENKKQIIERAGTELNKINERRTNHFSEILEHLDKVLLNISNRANKAESRGLGVSVARAAILNAENTIEVSRAAVKTQAAKVYTISVSTESALRSDANQAKKALRDDLMNVQEAVKLAHEAVKKAAVALAQIPRVDDDKSAPTATSTPTE